MMEWVIIGVLAVLLLLFISLYRRSLSEGRALGNYALLLLLDEGVYAVQRKGLFDLVPTIDAKNAVDLGFKVNTSLDHLAERLRHNTPLGVVGMLWKLKNTPL
jgi:hypothetical protein